MAEQNHGQLADGLHSDRKPAAQPAGEGDEHRLSPSVERVDTAAPGEDAQVASEPMSDAATLSRLGPSEPSRVPPGRQLSGEPPAV